MITPFKHVFWWGFGERIPLAQSLKVDLLVSLIVFITLIAFIAHIIVVNLYRLSWYNAEESLMRLDEAQLEVARALAILWHSKLAGLLQSRE